MDLSLRTAVEWVANNGDCLLKGIASVDENGCFECLNTIFCFRSWLSCWQNNEDIRNPECVFIVTETEECTPWNTLQRRCHSTISLKCSLGCVTEVPMATQMACALHGFLF